MLPSDIFNLLNCIDKSDKTSKNCGIKVQHIDIGNFLFF